MDPYWSDLEEAISFVLVVMLGPSLNTVELQCTNKLMHWNALKFQLINKYFVWSQEPKNSVRSQFM